MALLIVIGCIAAGVALLRRLSLIRGPVVRDLGPTELALLNGGGDLAVASSLAALHAAGAVTVTGGLVRPGAAPVHPDASPLDQAVHRAVVLGHQPWTSSDVRRHVGAAAGNLAATGVMIDTYRRDTVPVFAVAAVGAGVGLFARPDIIWSLLQGAGVVTLLGLAMLAAVDHRPWRTRSFVRRARRDAAFLTTPGGSALTAQEPQVAAFVGALFDHEALRTISPDLHAVCTSRTGTPFRLDGYRGPAPARAAVAGADLRYVESGRGPLAPMYWSGSSDSSYSGGSSGGFSGGDCGSGGFSGGGDSGGGGGGC